MNYRLEVDPSVIARFPDYSVMIIYATNLQNGPSDDASLALLREAEQNQRKAFGETKPATHPHIAAWRGVYAGMGVKPSKYLCSVEALLSRTLKGQDLPAINRLVDVYNAVSIRHVLPVGGEDWSKLEGNLVLKQANGQEDFLVFQDGTEVVTHPISGEVIWADRLDVTCRLWNWRQGLRTRLTEDSTHAYFVLDRLKPYSLDILKGAGQELMEYLKQFSPSCELEYELLGSQD